MKRMWSVALLETCLTHETISGYFKTQQNAGLAQFSGWSTKATRQKLIHQYWFTIVPLHFMVLVAFSSVILFSIARVTGLTFQLLGVFSGGLFIYSVLHFFLYRSLYHSIFIPRLENIKESFEKKELARMEKCRKSQLSNLSLTLIFFAIDKSCNLNTIQCNEESAKRISRLYGIDNGSVLKCLKLIIGRSGPMTARKATEIENQFEESCRYMEEIGFTKGIEIITSLERKLFSGR